jgi:hypothetical protein
MLVGPEQGEILAPQKPRLMVDISAQGPMSNGISGVFGVLTVRQLQLTG